MSDETWKLDGLASHEVSASGLVIWNSSASYGSSLSVGSKSTGKWYVEIRPVGTIDSNSIVGLARSDYSSAAYPGQYANSIGWASGGGVWGGTAIGSFTAGDVLCLAIDADSKKVWGRINNGAWANSGDPVAGTGELVTLSGAISLAASPYAVGSETDKAYAIQSIPASFSFSPPDGYSSWEAGAWFCYGNIVTPVVGAASYVDSGDFFDSWNPSQAFTCTIDHTKVPSTQANFPVLLNLSTTSGLTDEDLSLIFTKLGANCLKLAVVDATSGGQYFVEVEYWDAATNTAQLWVKVDELSSTEDTVLYLRFDETKPDNSTNVGVVGSEAGIAVWSNSYAHVYHLSQSPTGAGTLKDSLATVDGTAVNMDASNLVDAYLGKGVTLNGSDESVTVTFAGDIYTASVELSFKSTGTPATYDGIFTSVADITGSVVALIASSESAIGFYIGSGTASSPVAISDWAAWNHVSYSLSSSGYKLKNHLSGDSITGGAGSYYLDSASDLGYWYAEPRRFPGSFRDLFISSVVRSDDWLTASYNSRTDNLITYIPEVINYVTGAIAAPLAVCFSEVDVPDVVFGKPQAPVPSVNGLAAVDIVITGQVEQAVPVVAAILPTNIDLAGDVQSLVPAIGSVVTTSEIVTGLVDALLPEVSADVTSSSIVTGVVEAPLPQVYGFIPVMIDAALSVNRVASINAEATVVTMLSGRARPSPPKISATTGPDFSIQAPKVEVSASVTVQNIINGGIAPIKCDVRASAYKWPVMYADIRPGRAQVSGSMLWDELMSGVVRTNAPAISSSLSIELQTAGNIAPRKPRLLSAMILPTDYTVIKHRRNECRP